MNTAIISVQLKGLKRDFLHHAENIPNLVEELSKSFIVGFKDVETVLHISAIHRLKEILGIFNDPSLSDCIGDAKSSFYGRNQNVFFASSSRKLCWLLCKVVGC